MDCTLLNKPKLSKKDIQDLGLLGAIIRCCWKIDPIITWCKLNDEVIRP